MKMKSELDSFNFFFISWSWERGLWIFIYLYAFPNQSLLCPKWSMCVHHEDRQNKLSEDLSIRLGNIISVESMYAQRGKTTVSLPTPTKLFFATSIRARTLSYNEFHWTCVLWCCLLLRLNCQFWSTTNVELTCRLFSGPGAVICASGADSKRVL